MPRLSEPIAEEHKEAPKEPEQGIIEVPINIQLLNNKLNFIIDFLQKKLGK
jgi:hypothetical protein